MKEKLAGLAGMRVLEKPAGPSSAAQKTPWTPSRVQGESAFPGGSAAAAA